MILQGLGAVFQFVAFVHLPIQAARVGVDLDINISRDTGALPSRSWKGSNLRRDVPWPPPFEKDPAYGFQPNVPQFKNPMPRVEHPMPWGSSAFGKRDSYRKALPTLPGLYYGICRPDVKWARFKNKVFSDSYYLMHFLSDDGFLEQECKCCCASHADDSENIKEGELYCVPVSMRTKRNGKCPQIQKGQIQTHDMDRFWPRAKGKSIVMAPSDVDQKLRAYNFRGDRYLEAPGNATINGWKTASIGRHSRTTDKKSFGGDPVFIGYMDNELQDKVPNYCVKKFYAQIDDILRANAPKKSKAGLKRRRRRRK